MAVTGFATTAPPPIPTAHTGAEWLCGRHLLLWVHTGSAQVHLEDGQVHRLTKGEGIWVPADAGRRIATEPGAVAFPYRIARDTVAAAPTELVRFAVRDDWQDWLLLHYAHLVAPITSSGYVQSTLLNVLRPAGADPLPTSPSADLPHYPPMPTVVGARTVADELLRNPTIDHTVEDWAALVACSARTLRRDFLHGTGMTFAQWRSLCRLTVACEFLAAGYDIGQVAARSGFSSRNGFTRAFRGHYGITPRDYAARSRRLTEAPSERVEAVRQAATLAHLVADPAGSGNPPVTRQQPLPVTRTTLHTNDVHALIWNYRGTGYLRLDGKTHTRRKGHAIWIPAGVEHEAGTLEGSLGLPIGYLEPSDLALSGPLRTRFPASWDTYLLHCSVSACTRLRPEHYDRRHILELFREQVTAQRARTVPMPREPRARALASEFLRRINDPPDPTPDQAINDVFRHETGMSFASWCHAARMRIARELLTNGAKPTNVARQVGYTQASNFSRAFSRFHGISPRDYQERAHSE